MKVLLLFISIITALYLSRCSRDNSPVMIAEGSGTETTNGLNVESAEALIQGEVFRIQSDDSTSRRPLTTGSVRITIYASDYLSFYEGAFCDTAYTDIEGKFVFSALDSGYYNLLAVDTTDNKAVMVRDIPVFPVTESYSENNYFDTTGSVSGILSYTEDIDTIVAVIYIKGTPFADVLDTSDAFSLTRLPMGQYWLMAEYYIYQDSQYIQNTVPPVGNISNNVGRNILIDKDNLSQTIEISFFN
jgi:hypothetical protein